MEKNKKIDKNKKQPKITPRNTKKTNVELRKNWKNLRSKSCDWRRELEDVRYLIL